MVSEEVLELRVPLVIAGTECPFEDHSFDVVVEDLLSIAAEVLEGVHVTLDESIDVGGEGEDHVPHPRMSENHAETVDLPQVAVFLDPTALSPVYLHLDAGFGFVPENCLHGLSWPDRADIVSDDGVLSVKPHRLNLTADPGGTQGILADALVDILLELIEFARSCPAGCWCRHGLCGKVFSYRASVIPGLS
jgi:hypothetical protein